MINELITDLSYDKISLSQALTRSKLIANKIKNETFKIWLNRELIGYQQDDNSIASYRKILSEIELTLLLDLGLTRKIPFIAPQDLNIEIKDKITFITVEDPISVIENNIRDMKDTEAYTSCPIGIVRLANQLLKPKLISLNAVVEKAKRKFGKAQLVMIIELTKQKLLDILLELESEFPDLDNKYDVNEKNQNQIQNIVTNNIYGAENSPMNFATGKTVKQENNSNFSFIKEKLESFGIEDDEINELEVINNDNPKGSDKRNKKVMAWLGKVSASLASKGIYDKIPELVEFIGSKF